jgi:hypothetical protein
LQDPPKFTQIGISGLKTNHLATLAMSKIRCEKPTSGIQNLFIVSEYKPATFLIATNLPRPIYLVSVLLLFMVLTNGVTYPQLSRTSRNIFQSLDVLVKNRPTSSIIAQNVVQPTF